MQISTVDRGAVLTPELVAFAERRLLFALSRFDTRIDRTILKITDVNGPKGGIDKECQIQITMHRGSDIIITDKDADAYACIARAAERAGRTVARQLDRISKTRRGSRFVLVEQD